MTDTPTPAVIYARVSMDEQAKNYSLPTQVAAGRKYAGENGMVVAGEYLEDHTGAELSRPALDAMIAALRDGQAKTVIVYSIDRLARKLLYALMIEEDLRRIGVDVRYVQADYDDTPDGVLMKQISGSIAEYERARIKERMRRGKLGRLSAGYPLPSPSIPYGYRYVTTAPRAGRFEIEPDEAAVVRRIYGWYVDGLSALAISDRLTDLGVARPSKTGGRWMATTVLNIVKSPTYKGRYVWNRNKAPPEQWIYVDVPAIVEPETWERAQQMVERNRSLSRRNTRRDYLMRGRMRCGVCGRPLRCAVQQRKYSYYMCSGRFRQPNPDYQPGCSRFLIQADVDAAIWRQLVDLLTHPQELERRRAELAEAGDGARREQENDLASAQARLEEIERRQLGLIELYELGKIKVELLEKRNAALQEQHDRLKRETERARTALARLGLAEDALGRVRDYAARLDRSLDRLTVEEQRRVIDDLNVYATVYRGASAEDDRIVLYFR